MLLLLFVFFGCLSAHAVRFQEDINTFECLPGKTTAAWMRYNLSRPTYYECEFMPKEKRAFSRPSKLDPIDLSILKQGNYLSREEILASPAFTSHDANLYKELKYLLPAQAIVKSAKDPLVAKFVKTAVLNIISTNIGKRLCYSHSGIRVNLVSAFGMDEDGIKKAKKICPLPRGVEGAFSNMLDLPREVIRDFVIIISTDFPYATSGWTNSYGITYLMINPTMLTEYNFYELLIHEAYVLLDRLTSEVFDGNIADYMGAIQILASADHQGNPAFYRAMSNPYVMYSLVAYRAKVFESWVLWDMGYPDQRIQNLPTDCTADILDLIPEIMSLPNQNFLERFSNVSYDPLPVALKTLKENSQLCSKMYLPITDYAALGGTSGEGPRPRVGSGWGSSSSDSSEKITFVAPVKSDKFTPLRQRNDIYRKSLKTQDLNLQEKAFNDAIKELAPLENRGRK